MSSLFRRLNAARASPNASESGTPPPTAPPTSTASSSSRSHRPTFTCHTCQNPIPRNLPHIHVSRRSGEKRYHQHCFLCVHCHMVIDPKSQPFCFDAIPDNRTNGAVNEEHPFHRQCFADYFGWVCVVCDKTLPVKKTQENGSSQSKFEFLKHPFFEKERMCPHHALPQNSRGADNEESVLIAAGNIDTTEGGIGCIRRCSGCHRFEPISCPDKRFIDVDSGAGRCVCLACCRTVVTTSQEAEPLWEKVLDFFEYLGLVSSTETVSGVSRRSMSSIPILIVGYEALNDNLKAHSIGVHYGSSQIMTRGLCLSEHNADSEESLGVTAVLCLSSLPADLTSSILAHEATHAWIKLHPNFRYRKSLPLKVEEGLAQLIAFLFLNDGLEPVFEDPTSLRNDSSPSDSQLRQYFKYCIETDETLYGEGFRLAAKAYAEMGIQELLYYVALNHDFPRFGT
ncbi:hypothetical protein ACHAWX_007359 [Stephanocyclus meneghinianus]